MDAFDEALAHPPGSIDRILIATAAVDALTRHPLVLVGGAAQAVHTGVPRITDIDLVGVFDAADEAALLEVGFERDGRHLVLVREDQAIAVEIPDSVVDGSEEPTRVDTPVGPALVISPTDLMADRARQATDGSAATLGEATLLATAIGPLVDWPRLLRVAENEAARDPLLGGFPELVERLRRASR
ncbi:MAG: hypothetical protein AB1Z57_09435 [Acidimicrobiia bacterium]